ncbi:hypothetical protein OHT57_22105 [Streptomyces sp. NBC_00285]|uniref:hypothetical protein n=1 Tax=Streptomyces sp. NBC_00285 TaxID=2975700 RepID=UPI002E2D0B0A|nr:hypothetical protein [Streptomyces sp. NBC_00285]
MLLLWDHVIERHADALGQLDRADLCELAVGVIESTGRLFDPPFSEFFPPAAADLVLSTIRQLNESSPEWRLSQDGVAEFYRRQDSLPEVAIRPGVGPFVMAVMRLVGGVSGVMTADEVLEILSACYEAILMSQLTGRVTIQMQQENERCRAAIDLQEQLIARHLGI